jgi:phage tail tape-measure protein
VSGATIALLLEEITMKKTEKTLSTTEATPKANHVHASEVGALAGEVAGGIVGAIAGPAGAATGMIVGAMAGALAGEVMDREAKRAQAHDADLDDAIGVTSGDLGAPNLEHPPAKVGAYSSASAGAGTASRPAAEGPIPLDGDE